MTQVGIIMGSKSDLPVMQNAIDILKEFDVEIEVDIVSAHRTPKKMFEYAKNAKKRGLKVIIAGAGGAAHLPGMIASLTTIPVIGVPVKSSNSLDGWDSILSILQMPNGVPVATVALNAAKNAGILAAQIIATFDTNIGNKLELYKDSLEKKAIDSSKTI
jgi:5-(carboxyamino)imidazole ribonucleotide mutase